MKLNRRVVLLLALMVLRAPAAFAAEPSWVPMDSDDSSSFYYDKNATTKPREGVVRVIARAVYTEKGKAEAVKTLGGAEGLAALYESRYVYDIDCRERQARLLAATHMDKNSGILKFSDLSSFTEWEYLPAMTRMATVAEAACGK